VHRSTLNTAPRRDTPLIGVVGPCGSGKSTLIQGLEAGGFRCRHIAQEHSYVPYMWRRITNPDFLIYLGASFAVCTTRRRLNWLESDYLDQLKRLQHAREHANLVIETDDLSPAGVLEQAAAFLLAQNGAGPS
jgi:hypothetical protein